MCSVVADSSVNAAVEQMISFALPNVVAETLPPDMVNIPVTTSSINKTVIVAADVAVPAAAIEHYGEYSCYHVVNQ